MQMHDPKANSTRSSSTISASSSTVKLSYHSAGGGGNNSQVTSSASNKASGSSGSNTISTGSSINNNNTNSKASDHNHQKRGKKKTTRDRQQPTKDDKSASAMSNLSSYSLIDDDHIDDQETINVGNLIIDLESDLEKEKIESEQANNNVLESNSKYSNSSATNAPSSTSQLATSVSAPSSSTPSSSFANSNPSTLSKNNAASKSGPGHFEQNKSTNKQTNNQKSGNKKDTVTNAANSTSLSNNGHNVSSRTVFKSSADERGELKMKITRETKPVKNEHKIVTSPIHKSPTSSSGGLIGNQETSLFDHGSTITQGSSGISSTRECGTSTSIGTITEPECLGPCEPGTSVTLEGIVWQETDGGILVVNVTWRGKTYVGALLDCTRHDMNWAPPRLCDSPVSDIDAKTSKGNRAKRIVTRSNGIGLDEKNLLQTTGKLRNGKGRRIPTSNEPASCNKKQRETSDKPTGESSTAQIDTSAQQADNMASTISENPCPPVSMDTSSNSNILTNNSNNQLESPQEPGNNLFDQTGPESPTLIGCNEPNCNKKFRNTNGLLYHQSHAHSAENESTANQDDCSSTLKDKETKESDECTPASDDRLSPGQPTMQTGSPPRSISHDEKLDQRQHFALHPQEHKRKRSPSPDVSSKFLNTFTTDPMHSLSNPYPGMSPRDHQRPRLNDSPRITAVKNVNQERRNSSSPSQIGSVPRGPDHYGHKSSGMNPKHHLYDPQSQGSSSSSSNPQVTTQTSKSSSKQANPQPPLPAPTEEGMKPSGTSTGPPPAPHQANCYFNPAFLANSFNPYALPPYFPRHMYDPLTPPNIPTSNAAFLTRFMNNMRVPPPPDSPSRLLSPSMPKNVPFPPFKPDSGVIPPQIPTSQPLPNLSPMNNPPMPPMPVPPLPPLSMANIPNMRMPSPGDPIMPPSSQPPPFPGLGPMMGIPGMPANLLRPPLGGPPVPNLVDDPLAKHLPRRF